MPARTLTQLASRLRRETIPNGSATGTDRVLLTRFVEEQDEGAFEELVRRYDRLVRSAIAKVLSDPHDAEDAFQATFLILVRRAKSIDWRTGIGPWLYGVAHRVAVKARDAGRTRTRKEKEAGSKPTEPEPTSDLSWREACALLHSELDKLPDRYRLPLLLCYLEGKTRDEAASELKITVGTVKGRLERGREMLRTRLARRGVALSAGLLSAVATGSARACSSSSMSAVLEVARGSAPARVLSLTREAAMSTILSKLTKSVVGILGLAALASALLAAGATRPTDAPDEKQKVPATQPPAANPATGEEKKAEKAVPFLVNVVVKTPDGKPAANANVGVWAGRKKQVAGKTDDKGRLDLTVPTFFPKVTVIATAPGFAPDWAEFSPVFAGVQIVGPPLELTLREDSVALEGRVTDLEGRAVANIPVDVERIGKPKPGKTLDEHIKKRADPSLFDLDSISAAAAGLPTRVTTDKDGRFKITGVGKDRSVRITTRGETTEHLLVRVVTRAIDPKLEQHGPFGLHGAQFTIRVAPSRPIVGTVRDAKTGAPVPGIKVWSYLCATTTDKDGRFKLVGLKKDKLYSLYTGSLDESPYFDANVEVSDTSGFDAITADIKVHRGIVVTGRVTDERGKPVAGHLFYAWTFDNPHLKDYPGLEELWGIPRGWGELDRDGRYKLLVIPGPGALGVCAKPGEAFPRLDARKELGDLNILRSPIDAMHAVASVNFDPKEPKTLARDFTLTTGKTRALVIRGVDSKLPDKLLAVGQTNEAKPVAGDTLKLTGLSAKKARAVVLIDEAKTVGAVAAVTGDAETPVTVTLEKLGSVAGRVFDADGNPAAGAEVRAWLVLDNQKYDNLPPDDFPDFGMSGVVLGAWSQVTGRATKADKDGRFTLPSLIPGQTYRLAAAFNPRKPNSELLHRHDGFTVKPGEALDLGDLKPKK